MPKKDEELIALLEEEAAVLRHRIAGLASRSYPAGVTTGDDEALSPSEELEADHKARLAEIEAHLRELKRSTDAA